MSKPIFAHERLRRVQRRRIQSPNARRGLPRHRRRPAFAPASRRALERYTAETSIDLRSECFDPTLPARTASFTASSRRATPATARSESSPIFAHEPTSLDANRRRVFGERGRCD